MVEIVDEKSAKAWGDGKPEEVRLAFAARCALRVLPALSLAESAGLRRIAVPVMRAILSTSLESAWQTPEMKRAAHVARGSAYRTGVTIDPDSSVATGYSTAALSAGPIFDRPEAVVTNGANVIYYCVEDFDQSADVSLFARASTYAAASADASRLDADEPLKVFDHRLWREAGIPEALQTHLDALRTFWGQEPAVWGFWSRWYEGMFEGRPLDWDLQREVALIPDDDWEKGPEHIARLIEKIEARFALMARIRELEEELARASRDRFGIGGNNPPEAIKDAPSIAKEFTIIWAPLQELKSEVERDHPEASRIAGLLTLLGDALRHGLRWCASKADLIVDTSIKWAVPAIGTGYLALNPDKLAAVIEAGKRLVSILP